MNEREFGWTAKEGQRVYAREWTPDGADSITAVILIVHGMGEHSERYRHVAEWFTTAGYAVYAFDQLGHGRTDGKRGHTSHYDDLLDPIDRLKEEADRSWPGKRQFLYGHSMGGNLTLNYLLRRKPDVAGAVVTSPWLKLAFDPPALQVTAARLLERLYPKFTNDRPFNPNHLTSDPEMIKRLKEDTLGHGKITARFFLGVHRAGRWAIEHAPELSTPLLLMHGGSDTVTSFTASRLFAERAGNRYCTFREWPDCRHELHNERRREEVFAVIHAWLRDHLAT